MLSELLSTGSGLRFSAKIYRTNRGKRFSAKTYGRFVLFLQKSAKVFGNFREFTGKCNLGIPYSGDSNSQIPIPRFQIPSQNPVPFYMPYSVPVPPSKPPRVAPVRRHVAAAFEEAAPTKLHDRVAIFQQPNNYPPSPQFLPPAYSLVSCVTFVFFYLRKSRSRGWG